MIGLDHVPMDVRGQQGQYQQNDSSAKIDGWDAAGMPHTSTVRRRREFENYVYVKGREIDEQRLSWRYYHIDQWTVEQLRVLRRRQQPAITFDRTGRKIDSLSGTIRRLRTDPKVYPNTPNGEQGAEVATQVIRTICDASHAEDLEAAFPGSEDLIRQSTNNDGGYWTAFDTDREPMWIDIYHRVRLIDHWYKKGNVWMWSLHTGIVELMSGVSPYINQRGQSISKFNAFAAFVDIHGDHYGMIRRLRGPQDAINQHRSKAIHIMNTRQIKLKEGAVDDVEVTRREAARPDGVIVYRGDKNDLDILQPDQEF